MLEAEAASRVKHACGDKPVERGAQLANKAGDWQRWYDVAIPAYGLLDEY